MFYKQMALVEEAVEKQVNAGNCPETRTKEESSEPEAHKRNRKGGKGSRLRRLLVHQLLLTERRGLPLSRLLRMKGTEAKSWRKGREEQEESQRQGRREQEESASPLLRRRRPELEGEEERKKNGERGG